MLLACCVLQVAPDTVAAAHQRMLDTLGMGAPSDSGFTNVPVQPGRIKPSSAEAAERLLQNTVQVCLRVNPSIPKVVALGAGIFRLHLPM